MGSLRRSCRPHCAQYHRAPPDARRHVHRHAGFCLHHGLRATVARPGQGEKPSHRRRDRAVPARGRRRRFDRGQGGRSQDRRRNRIQGNSLNGCVGDRTGWRQGSRACRRAGTSGPGDRCCGPGWAMGDASGCAAQGEAAAPRSRRSPRRPPIRLSSHVGSIAERRFSLLLCGASTFGGCRRRAATPRR